MKSGLRGSWLAATIALGMPLASAQYAERPDLAGSGSPAVDVSGRSIKNKRIRAVHSDDPDDIGSSAYLIRRDPFLAYQLGRNLNFREFRERDGIFDLRTSNLGGPMPDGTTAKITANNQTSCSGCHNLPQGNPGGGVTFHKDSGKGRNSPHYYGAGIMEMLALQVRTEMLLQLDSNKDGWVSAAEANAAGSSVMVQPAGGAPFIDYGDPSLSNGATGSPALNNIFRVWYVDAQGVVVPGATEVDGVNTFGYNFEMILWGWGQGIGRSALNPTNRAFLWDPLKAHSGLESFDPTTNSDPDGDGISAPSLAGAIQFPVSHKTADKGNNLDPLGFSRDDPDGDGFLSEITEGDLDLGEWFMLNVPRPAFEGNSGEFFIGMNDLQQVGCTSCHVSNWRIHPEDQDFAGDRRLFDYQTTWKPNKSRFEGKLVPLYTKVGQDYIPNRDGFDVQGLFTDLRHHEMGDRCVELDFGGNKNSTWRTPPLWGVGSGFPWMHDGQSLTIEHAILRHGGEALASRLAYEKAPLRQRVRILDFLSRLVLYDIESTPADLDGNNNISLNFKVNGVDTGVERFNAEWLFRNPVRIQGLFTNTDGDLIRSNAAVNLDAAYGQLLPYRIDSDSDGWPDVWDNAPFSPGYKDGIN